jgi:hypothetical protein
MVAALAAPVHAEQFSLDDFPAPLVKKVVEIKKACGSQIVSAYRPGAVTPYGNASEHAFRRAVDLSGNPKCIYEHLQGWEGGALWLANVTLIPDRDSAVDFNGSH